MAKETVNQRAKRLREEKGISQSAMAKKVGLTQPTLSAFENGTGTTSALPQIARELGVTVEQLDSGVFTESNNSLDGIEYMPVFAWEMPSDLDPNTNVIVPRVDVSFAAGDGHEAYFEPQYKEQGNAYRLEWIRVKGFRPEKLICVYVDGDSMEPKLPDSSLVTIDTSKNTFDDVVEGKVYAIRYGNKLKIKRLSKRFDGALIIDSDNPKYTQEVVEAEQLEHIGIIGRYVAHSFDGDI